MKGDETGSFLTCIYTQISLGSVLIAPIDLDESIAPIFLSLFSLQFAIASLIGLPPLPLPPPVGQFSSRPYLEALSPPNVRASLTPLRDLHLIAPRNKTPVVRSRGDRPTEKKRRRSRFFFPARPRQKPSLSLLHSCAHVCPPRQIIPLN